MKRPLAYLTAAWSGEPDVDMELAAHYCRLAYEAGFSPICPLLYLPLFLNDSVPEEHKAGIDMRRDMLRRSHTLIVCGSAVDEDRSKKKMNVPMRDCTIVDNTHEAIIPAEQFELVQRILETETRRPNDAETVALFAGFLYCGDCGSRLVRRSASYKGKRYIYYQCSGSKQNRGSCTSHNLRDEKLYNIVRNALQMQIQLVMEEAEFVESIRQARQVPYRVRHIERQIRQLTAEKAHIQGIKEKLYGDYADEILTREDFLNYNELYSKRIEEYDHKITELEAEQQNLQTAPNAYPFLDVYRKYRKLEEITRPMVVELIEKIEVYEGNRVEITFRFQDEIADLLEELHQKQMGQHEASA